jgi:multidrug resistance protein
MRANARGPASLGVIFGIVLLDLLGFGILIPQLGIYGVKFDASPFAVGLLLSVYSLMQLLFAPVLGRLSDRYGRRPVLLYSVAGSLLGYLLFAFARSLPLLFLARIVDGISGGNISTAQAYISDVTTKENRAKGMGMIGAAFGLGFILGPGLGGFLGALGGNLAIGLGAAGLAAVNLVFAFFWLPESRQPGSAPAAGKSLGGLGRVLRLPVLGLVLGLFLLFTTAFSQMEGTFSVFLLIRHVARAADVGVGRDLFSLVPVATGPLLKEASWRAGFLFATVGVVSAIVQGGLIGRLRGRFGEGRLVVAGTVLTCAGLFLIPVMPVYGWLFLPMCLLAAGSGLTNPSMSAVVSLHAPPERQGEVLGAYQAMGSLGRILGPALGGFLFTVEGPSLPYVVAGLMMAVGVVGAVLLARRLVQTVPPSAGP